MLLKYSTFYIYLIAMVTSMLEKAIEIEGLLRIIRDGDPLPETYKLLKSKIKSLSAEAAVLIAETALPDTPAETPKAEAPDADFIMEHPTAGAIMPKVDFTSPTALPQTQPLVLKQEAMADPTVSPTDMTEVDLDLEEEDDIILSFDDIPETAMMAEASSESPDDDETDNEDNPSKDDDIAMEEETEIKAPDEANEEEGHMNERLNEEETPAALNLEEATAELNLEETAAELNLEETADIEVESAPTPKRPVKLKSAFSLNDRFLYARELFNGNMKIFDSTIDHIESIGDFPSIEDYLYHDLGWNAENTNVVSFVETLRPQFK